MTRRRRLPGVEIRTGAVREARHSAGLSLAQVAGSDLTRAAIHLIETGGARPSMPTLELIARRTGRPVSFFLAEGGRGPAGSGPAGSGPAHTVRVAGSDIARAERLRSAGKHAEAAAFAQALLRPGMNAWSEARLRLIAGSSLVQSGEHAAGDEHLQRAHVLFEQMGDRWEAAECLYFSAGSLYLREDPAALEVAKGAAEICRRLSPVPEATLARVLSLVGAIHVHRREWRAALDSYSAAGEAAGSLRDLHQLVRSYEGLSLAYAELGDLDRASHYADRIMALNAIERDRSLIARTQNNLGLVLMHQGRLEEAEEKIRAALEFFESEGGPGSRDHVLLSLAEVRLARGDDAAARDIALEAHQRASEAGAPLTVAVAEQLLGQVAAAAGDQAEVDRRFERALALLGELRVPDRLAECHSVYADILAARGDSAGAYRQLRAALDQARPELRRDDRLEELAQLA